jgi:AraC-like DNA-binding protein
LGKIAADLQQALAQRALEGSRGGTLSRGLAAADGWTVADVLCTLGPRDQPFEEQHGGVCIAMVVAGAFGYRSGSGRALLTPGALLLGNTGECFECGHRHGAGDRCLAFHYAPDYFERLAVDAGIAGGTLNFRHVRIPPLRSFAPLIARACSGATRETWEAQVTRGGERDHIGLAARASQVAQAAQTTQVAQTAQTTQAAWNELVVELAAAALQAAGTLTRPASDPGAAAWSRVVQTIHLIDATPADPHTLGSLARAAGLSEFYFLRTFQRVTGVTPHQYLLRARLRSAALQVAGDTAKIIDIALACGFNDLSNFNHAFRQEFDVSPRAWRARNGRTPRARGRARSA